MVGLSSSPLTACTGTRSSGRRSQVWVAGVGRTGSPVATWWASVLVTMPRSCAFLVRQHAQQPGVAESGLTGSGAADDERGHTMRMFESQVDRRAAAHRQPDHDHGSDVDGLDQLGDVKCRKGVAGVERTVMTPRVSLLGRTGNRGVKLGR
jgi:hypothetical protein